MMCILSLENRLPRPLRYQNLHTKPSVTGALRRRSGVISTRRGTFWASKESGFLTAVYEHCEITSSESERTNEVGKELQIWMMVLGGVNEWV